MPVVALTSNMEKVVPPMLYLAVLINAVLSIRLLPIPPL